jgi:hypothetical protein
MLLMIMKCSILNKSHTYIRISVISFDSTVYDIIRNKWDSKIIIHLYSVPSFKYILAWTVV